MRNINGTNYISVKEYAALKNVTVGRVSQLKSELPFEKLEDLGVELINYDLLELEEKETVHAQTKFQTTHPLHTYSYKQMGMFVVEMAKTGNEARANAETLLIEKDAMLENKNGEIGELLETNADLNRRLKDALQKNEELNITLRDKDEAFNNMEQAYQSQKMIAEQLEDEKRVNLKNIEDLNTIQQKLQADFDREVVENQGLMNDNTIHRVQLENLSKEIEREKLSVEILRNDLRQALEQKETLGKEQAILKLSEQKAIHENELSLSGIKALQKENAMYQKQIEVLSKNLESGSGFNQRLDKLEGMLLKIPQGKEGVVSPKTVVKKG